MNRILEDVPNPSSAATNTIHLWISLLGDTRKKLQDSLLNYHISLHENLLKTSLLTCSEEDVITSAVGTSLLPQSKRININIDNNMLYKNVQNNYLECYSNICKAVNKIGNAKLDETKIYSFIAEIKLLIWIALSKNLVFCIEILQSIINEIVLLSKNLHIKTLNEARGSNVIRNLEGKEDRIKILVVTLISSIQDYLKNIEQLSEIDKTLLKEFHDKFNAALTHTNAIDYTNPRFSLFSQNLFNNYLSHEMKTNRIHNFGLNPGKLEEKDKPK